MTNAERRAEELRLIEEAVASGKVRRFPPGGGVFSGEEAVQVLKQRGYEVSQSLGSYKVSTVSKGMNADEIMRFASFVKVTDAYATPAHMHAAKKAFFASQAGLQPRKTA